MFDYENFNDDVHDHDVVIVLATCWFVTVIVAAAAAAAAAADASTPTDDASVCEVVENIGGSNSYGNDDHDGMINGAGGSHRRWFTVDRLGIADGGDGWIESNQFWYIIPTIITEWNRINVALVVVYYTIVLCTGLMMTMTHHAVW